MKPEIFLYLFGLTNECLAARLKVSAGWSSQVARRAHNPKVAGSNPAPATNILGGLANGG